MRKYLIFTLFTLVASSTQPSEVPELTDCNFHKRTTSHDYVLVLYTTSWCTSCERIKTQFQRILKFIESDHPKLAVGYVNCSTNGKETCNKNAIADFPRIKLYHKGHYVKDYDDTRASWHMYKFLRAQIHPPSQELSSVEDFRKFLAEQHDAVLVGFFEEDTKMKKFFFKLAEEWKEKLIFAHSSCEKLLRKEGVFDGLVLFRPIRYTNSLEEDRFLYRGRPVIGEIKIFITTHYHGLVGLRTPYNLLDFTNPLVIAYYANEQGKYLKPFFYWRNRMLRTADKFRTICHFAISLNEDFEDELKNYGIQISSKDVVVVARALNAKKYVMTEEFSTEALDEFVQNFLDGKLKPYVKSKQIPRNNNGPVFVAVANNFEALVTNSTKDILIEFYAPTCSVSQKVASILDQLAENLKDEDVTFVKMDATENDIMSEYQVLEYPTIYWVPKGNKTNPILYQGPKENFNELMKFIAEMTTLELEGYDRRGNPKIKKTEL